MKYKSKLVPLVTLLITCLATSISAQTSEFSRAADQLCDKMTACIVKQISEDDELPPQMKDMATAMAKNMCASFYEFEGVIENTNLIDSALACFKSVEEQSCTDLMDGFETPECKEFEELAEKSSK